MIQLSIVIPVFNAEKSIGLLVDNLMLMLSSKYILEIILVNDASKDDSAKCCTELEAKYKENVYFFSLAKNVGEHAAVLAGLNQVTGDFIVLMDDDFQNPIEEINTLVLEIQAQDKDVIYTFSTVKKDGFIRKIGSKIHNRMANWMLIKPKDLYLSSFKILNRFLVDEIIKYELPFPYIDGLILQTTDSIGKIKVEHAHRKFGKSGYSLRKLVSLWSNMFLNFSLIPLRFVIVLGFTTAFIAFLFAIFTIIEKIVHPNLPAGYSTIIIAISFFSGLILIGIGMLGEYIGRIFISQGKKPQFTIRPKKKLDGK